MTTDREILHKLRYGNAANVSRLECFEGKTLKSIRGIAQGSEEIIFEFQDGSAYVMYHAQDCCETVSLCDFEVDFTDEEIDGAVIRLAEEITNHEENTRYESATWTFYKIETSRGGMWLRWLGESNGYYSESVYIDKIN